MSAFLRPKFKPFGMVRGPFGAPRPLARHGRPWLLASNPNAHEDEEEEEDHKQEEVVHSPDHVEEIIIPELLSTLIGFYNEDGTVQKFHQVARIPEKIPMKALERIPMKVPQKIPEKIPEKMPEKITEKITEKTSEKMPENTPEKARRKRNLNIRRLQRSIAYPIGHLIDSFEVSTSSDRQVSCDSVYNKAPQLTGPSFQGTDNGYLNHYNPCGDIYRSGEAFEPRRAARELPKIPYRMRQGALRNRYESFNSHDHTVDSSNDKGLRRLKFFTQLRDFEDLLGAETVPAEIQAIRKLISQSSPPEGTLDFKNALNEYLSTDKNNTVGSSDPSAAIPNTVISIDTTTTTDTTSTTTSSPTDDAEISEPLDKPDSPPASQVSPGTVINYNFFQIGCGRDNNLKRNAQQTCLEALSQIPHRIDKRKGAPDLELFMDGTSMESPVIYNEDFITIPTRKMFKPSRSKASGRKLKQWKTQQSLASEELEVEESQPKPTIVIGSCECNDEPIRSRGPRDSRYRPNRADHLPIRLFTPPDNSTPLRRSHQLVTDDQSDAIARRLRPKFGLKMKSRRTYGPPTTTTEQTTTTTTELPTTTQLDSTSRKRMRFRSRPKKSVGSEEFYESQLAPVATEVRPISVTPSHDKPSKTGKGHWKKTMKLKNTGQRTQMAKSRVHEDKWEKIFALTTVRSLPRRSINESPMRKQARRDPRWRLKRQQQFKQRRFRGLQAPEPVNPEPINVFTTTTSRPRSELRAERLGRTKPTDPPPQVSYSEPLERSQPAPKSNPIETNDERRQRRTRPVYRQASRPRLSTSSAEIMSMGPPREPIVQSRTGIPPSMQDFIIRQVKEHCVQCNPNEVVKNQKSRSASPARYYSSYRNKPPQSIRTPRTQPPAPSAGFFGMNPRM